MLKNLNAADPNFSAALQKLRTPPAPPPAVRRRVAGILRRVRRGGDSAVAELTAELDGWKISALAEAEVSAEELSRAVDGLDESLRDALEEAAWRLQNYHARQKPQSWQMEDADGNIVGENIFAVRRAAVYAPGGKAAYPSSVLMGVIPAKIAGVEEVWLTAPAPGGAMPPVTLAAAKIAGADKVFKLGGAVAVAAFAYGTQSIGRADVIVGPGNSYVAEAKRQLAGVAGFDSYAGPSEVLIICDKTAKADWVAADLIAQAEHDEEAQSIVVCADAAHLQKVQAEIAAQLPTKARAKIIAASLAKRGAAILARDIKECIQIAETIAPEHLQVMTKNAEEVAEKIRCAGGIFIGKHSCVPMGDYAAGPNHILPTGGTARFASPLGVENFIKRSGILHASEDGAAELAKLTNTIAQAEGLPAHAESANLRGGEQ